MTAQSLQRINALVVEVRQLKGENNQLRERNTVLEDHNRQLRDQLEHADRLNHRLMREMAPCGADVPAVCA